ncbi:Cofilin [Drechslerella dactyloides]|uniref:Cofilin n=1 Tax=Drechslerella dactyloides TaxID=74499 RepID=A0AAD6IUQ8_DREDA|nr:Cofilin [Drechslerella dactyloides]
MAVTGTTVAGECRAAYEDFTRRKVYKYVIYAINDHNEIIVDQTGPRHASHADFTAELLSTECRYAVITVDFHRDGVPQSAIVFVDWSPSDAKTGQRMLYAEGKAALANMREGVCLEICANEPEEVALGALLRSLDADEEGQEYNGIPETCEEVVPHLNSLGWPG